ncbi:hypothetical protein L1887_09181 [Cichorium endivia]|nr:hypothetical protein L1887_09181 [Cichorium endivia]
MLQPSAPIVSVSQPSAPYCQLCCSSVTPLFQRLSKAIPPPAPNSTLNDTLHLRSTAPSHRRSFLASTYEKEATLLKEQLENLQNQLNVVIVLRDVNAALAAIV